MNIEKVYLLNFAKQMVKVISETYGLNCAHEIRAKKFYVKFGFEGKDYRADINFGLNANETLICFKIDLCTLKEKSQYSFYINKDGLIDIDGRITKHGDTKKHLKDLMANLYDEEFGKFIETLLTCYDYRG